MPLAPLDGPLLDGQIGINLRQVGACVGVTLCHYTSERKRQMSHRKQKQQASLIVPLVSCTPLCINGKQSWWKQVAVLGREQTPRKWDVLPLAFLTHPLFLLTLPLGRIIQKSYLVEMSSCGGDGAKSVTECRNASWNGALAMLGTPQVSLTLQALIYAATPASTNGQRVCCLPTKVFSHRWCNFFLLFWVHGKVVHISKAGCMCLFQDIDFMPLFIAVLFFK